MRPFRYQRATDVAGAVAMLTDAPRGAFLAAGTNLVDLMKLEVVTPDLLIDVRRLTSDRIEPLPDGGVRIGAAVTNSDLAGYHIAANADVRSIEAHWPDLPDPHTNPMGAKGLGEVCIVGTAAAIANTAYHATGIRVRDLPITLDRFLQ